MEGNVAYCLLTEDGKPSTFHEATKTQEASLWMAGMQEEIEALHKNKTRDLVLLHKEGRPSRTNGFTRSNEMAMIKWSGIVLDCW